MPSKSLKHNNDFGANELSEYDILSLIGRGSSSFVHKVRHRKSDKIYVYLKGNESVRDK